MKCELCFDDNCLDLPSLTEIQGSYDCIHRYMGYVILESMIWFDLIWIELNRHSKSHWKQHSLWRWILLFHCWFASNKYFSVSSPFSRFRCSCSRKSHSKYAESNKKGWRLMKTVFLLLAERRRRKSSSTVVEIYYLFWLQPKSNTQPIQLQIFTLFFLSFLFKFHQLLQTYKFHQSSNENLK